MIGDKCAPINEIKRREILLKNTKAKRAGRNFAFPETITILMIMALVLLVPSSGPVGNYSDMLSQPTPRLS